MIRISELFHRVSVFCDRRQAKVYNRPRFRPAVEGLEPRDVPSLFTWIGNGSTDFDNQNNWDQDGGTATRLPATS
jgi:hypothetical protein